MFLPFKKRSMTENSLSWSNTSESKPKSESNDSNDDDEEVTNFSEEEYKKNKLKQLQRKAFYSLLHAFIAETSMMSNKRTLIIQMLMKEWNINHETYSSFVDNIKKNLIVQQERDDSFSSDEKVMEKVEEATYVHTSSSSYGNVDPESLVGKWVRVRMPGEDDFEEFIIKEYDAKQEMHHLETADPNAMEMDEMLSWMDFREVPHEDIMWEDGERPNF